MITSLVHSTVVAPAFSVLKCHSMLICATWIELFYFNFNLLLLLESSKQALVILYLSLTFLPLHVVCTHWLSSSPPWQLLPRFQRCYDPLNLSRLQYM